MSANKRITIAVLTDFSNTDYQQGVLAGIDYAVQEYDCNLIVIEGGIARFESGALSPGKVIFDLALSKKIDAIIIFAANIGIYCTYDEQYRFAHTYSHIPIVSLSQEIEDISSILVNNHNGLIEMLDHLVKDHNYKKFLYFRGPIGNYDADERMTIFENYLKEKKIPFNQGSIIQGNFTINDSMQNFEIFMDTHPFDYDAIVCANDAMAVGVIRVLNHRGFSVSEDICVVGFDNFFNSRYASPPLTTVSQPMFKMGQNAVTNLLAQINEKKNTLTTYLPTTFIKRESCGCTSNQTNKILPDIEKNINYDFETYCRHNIPLIRLEIEHLISLILIQYKIDEITTIAEEMIVAFIKAIFKTSPRIFFDYWDKFLKKAHYLEHDYILLRDLLTKLGFSIMQKASSHEELFKIEELWKGSLEFMAKQSIIIEKKSNLEINIGNSIIDDIRSSLVSNTSISEFSQVLEKTISHLELNHCYISIFEKKGNQEGQLAESSTLLFGFQNDSICSTIDQPFEFPTQDILPDSIFDQNKRYSLHAELLATPQANIGVLFIDFNHKKLQLLRSFRQVLSNSLFSRNLILQVKQQKEDLKKNISIIRKTMGGFIQTLQQTVEMRDPYTAGHQRRVSELARMIAQEMGLDHQLVETVRVGGVIHDLGKLHIPSEILNKPGKLRDIEMQLLQTHPQIAFEILKPIDFPWAIADVVVQHHEHIDGSGYPFGLKDKEIMREAKIISVADVVEAMASHRPYRPAIGLDLALEEIVNKRGVWFDPDTVDTCIFLIQSGKYTLNT